jgi:hypothetical protein
MWVSHTQRVPSQRVHLIVTRASRLLRLGGPTQHCRVGAAPSLALHRAFRCGACQKPCNTHADWRPYSRRPSTDIASLIHSSAVRSHASLSSGLTALAACSRHSWAYLRNRSAPSLGMAREAGGVRSSGVGRPYQRSSATIPFTTSKSRIMNVKKTGGPAGITVFCIRHRNFWKRSGMEDDTARWRACHQPSYFKVIGRGPSWQGGSRFVIVVSAP